MSSHLIGQDKQILRFVPTQLPANLIYMPRSDGRELSLTYLREQEVFAWAEHETQGLYKDIMIIKEEGVEVRYQAVERKIRGTWHKYLERAPLRLDDYAENYWGVDCGLHYPLTSGVGEIFADAETGTTTITTENAIFTSGNIGDIIYYAGGKFQIETVPTSYTVTGTWLRDADNVLPQGSGNIPIIADTGEWEYATPTSEISGLWHLEGETISVCADGNAILDRVVVDGKVSIGFPATKIYGGLQYICDFQTLPIVLNNANVISLPKRIYAVFPRLLASRGMSFGTSFDNLFEMKDRTDELWGDSLELRADVSELLLDDGYSLDQYLCGRQKYPLPATILGYSARFDSGDPA